VQALAQFGSLPAGVDLIVMLQEKVSASKVAATAAKVSAAGAPHISPLVVPPFPAAPGPSAITHLSSPAPPPAAAIAARVAPPIVPPTVAPVPSALPHTVAPAPSSSSNAVAATAAKVSAAVAILHVSPPAPLSYPHGDDADDDDDDDDAAPSVYSIVSAKSASSTALALAKSYYDDIEFASRLCCEFAAAESSSPSLSSLFYEAHSKLQLIVAGNAHLKSLPSIRQPLWPRHEALIRFDLPLQRLTTHFTFSKKWFPRFFCMRERRLYYSDGKNGHPDTKDGTLAFMRRKPAPDGRYCVDLQGMLTRA
jgi:hypothetical protein